MCDPVCCPEAQESRNVSGAGLSQVMCVMAKRVNFGAGQPGFESGFSYALGGTLPGLSFLLAFQCVPWQRLPPQKLKEATNTTMAIFTYEGFQMTSLHEHRPIHLQFRTTGPWAYKIDFPESFANFLPVGLVGGNIKERSRQFFLPQCPF